MKQKKVLIIEPYFGGSHKQFLMGLKANIEADYTWLVLPARKWKMRMQLSAPWVVEQIKAMKPDKRYFDTILCSTFVDVAVLRSLLSVVQGVNPSMRYCTYFHENQYVYPEQLNQEKNHQFSAINFTTALASDYLAFNSLYNLTSFVKNSRMYIKKAADMNIMSLLEDIEEKSSVIYPGMDFGMIDKKQEACINSIYPIIVWNHRWEHDKNPEEFFNTLYLLKKKKINFRLILLGQAFTHQPRCFEEAKGLLKDEILHYGFIESKKEYARILCSADIIVSTAVHEFFGIAVLEAVRAGCMPLLPDRLSYPEIFEKKYRYSEGGLVQRLEKLLHIKKRLEKIEARKLTNKFQWNRQKSVYEDWLFG